MNQTGNRPAVGRRRSDRRANDAGNGTPSTWLFITSVGSPLALGTALLFYFGWVRTSVQMHELGFDSSVMGLSTADYILKSINVLSVPLVLLLILALALSGLHQGIVAPRVRRSRQPRQVQKLARILGRSWIVWAFVVLFLLMLTPSALVGFAVPVGITLAVLCALYGRTLNRQVSREDPWSPARRTLTVALLAFAIFWDTERLARLIGEGYAADIAANPRQLTAVIIYSGKSLGITAPGVIDTPSTDPKSAYQHRYSGLRLLQRVSDKYFLINERWDSHTGRVFVFRDADNMRLEFTR